MEETKKKLYEGLKELELDLWDPEGAFYILPKVENAKYFVFDIFTKYNVITYKGDWFGATGRVRFSYALNTNKIEEGLSRINDYLKK